MTNDLPPSLDACLDLINDLLSPEVYGHSIPSDVKARAFVIKRMLERLKARMESGTCPEA